MCNCNRCNASGGATFSSMDYWEIVGNVTYRAYKALMAAGSNFSDEDIIEAIRAEGVSRVEQHYLEGVRRERAADLEDEARHTRIEDEYRRTTEGS